MNFAPRCSTWMRTTIAIGLYLVEAFALDVVLGFYLPMVVALAEELTHAAIHAALVSAEARAVSTIARVGR